MSAMSAVGTSTAVGLRTCSDRKRQYLGRGEGGKEGKTGH